MNTITDDQIAEIEHAATEQLEAGLEPGFALALITRLREAEREAIKTLQILAPAIAYIDSLDISKPGQSIIKTLIEDHKRLREAERDARRLEWLIGEQCIVESQNGIGRPIVYRLFWRHLGERQAEWYPSERAAIDAAMQAAREAAE